jgi:hypothetical protein
VMPLGRSQVKVIGGVVCDALWALPANGCVLTSGSCHLQYQFTAKYSVLYKWQWPVRTTTLIPGLAEEGE